MDANDRGRERLISAIRRLKGEGSDHGGTQDGQWKGARRDEACVRRGRPRATGLGQSADQGHGAWPAPSLAGVVRQLRPSRHDGDLSRALSQLRAHARGAAWRQADHRHRADGLRPLALQPPPSRARQARARGHPRGGRGGDRISGASDPGDRQTADRGTRPQPRLSRPRRGALRLSARRRGADDRLRQDDAGLHHGGSDREHPRHRAFGRADAERLAPRHARRLGHHLVAGAPGFRGRQDRLQRDARGGRRFRALGRPLQHHGHGLDHELARRGARHVAARLRRHSGPLPRARPDRLSHRKAHRRHGARGPQAFRHSHARGLRERHRRQLRDRRLDQCADPPQRHRPPHRREARGRGLGEGGPQGAASRQHAARRLLSRRGVSPRRRRAGRGRRAHAPRAHPRETP